MCCSGAADIEGFGQPSVSGDRGRQAFFWLGDTAWELFHRLNREEADKYLKNRAEGFTVIQAVAMAEFDGLTEPNPTDICRSLGTIREARGERGPGQ